MFPSPSPPPPSRPKKVVTQRQYREKEGIYFNTLRNIIKELTGEELPTRQEILKKAIDLLLETSDTRKQMDAQVVPSTAYNVLAANNSAKLASDHAGAQWDSYHFLENWHPKGRVDSYTGSTQMHGQLDYSNPDSRLDSGNGYQEYHEDWALWSYHP